MYICVLVRKKAFSEEDAQTWDPDCGILCLALAYDEE